MALGDFIAKFGSQGAGADQFVGPTDVHVSDGLVYVPDAIFPDYRIKVFNAASPYTFIKDIGSRGSADGQFQFNQNLPLDIATDSTRLYVPDTNNRRVQIFDKVTHAFIDKFGVFGAGNGQFNSPIGLDVDDNFIYVVDSAKRDLQIFDKTSFAFVAKIALGTDTFYTVSVDDSFMYVLVANTGEIKIYNKTSPYALVDTITGLTSGPFDIEVDSQYVYVVIKNSFIYRIIEKVSPYNTVIQFGSSGSGDGQFNQGWGTSIDNGLIYVAERGGTNWRVQIFEGVSEATAVGRRRRMMIGSN